MATGSRWPGIADEACTASPTSASTSSRPNTTRFPESRLTAQIQVGSCGQGPGSTWLARSAMVVPEAVPSGRTPAMATTGRGRFELSNSRTGSIGLAGHQAPERATGSAMSSRVVTRSAMVCPSALRGEPVQLAARSAAQSPALSETAVAAPAEVPTMTSAVRGSQPVASETAASTPAWNAAAFIPPALRTRPMLVTGWTSLSPSSHANRGFPAPGRHIRPRVRSGTGPVESIFGRIRDIGP